MPVTLSDYDKSSINFDKATIRLIRRMVREVTSASRNNA